MKKIILLISIFLLSGCYNYKELNELAIVSSLSIDKKDNNYLVGAQIMNAKNDKESNASNIIVYEAKGKSIDDALRKMTKKSDKKIYGGHLNKVVISEKVARENIINIIDLFQRLPEIKDEFTITISKNIDANKVIKIMTSTKSIPADYVINEIEQTDIETALTYSSKLDEFVSIYLKKYIDPVISTIEVKNYNKNSNTSKNTEESFPKTKIELNNIAITHNGKLDRFLNEKQTIGYNFITNNIDEIVMPIKCDKNNYTAILLNNSKTKNKIIKKNNKYIIELNIYNTGTINEYNCLNNLNINKNITKLENKTKNKIKEYINSSLELQNNTKSEYLGLKRMIYLKYPKYNNEEYDIKTNIYVNLNKKGELQTNSKGEKYGH